LKKLDLKQKAFVEALAKDPERNQTKAALAAGYSASTASKRGSELMARPEVQNALQEFIGKASKRSLLTVERVQEELARLAFSDPAELVDEHGKLKPLHEIEPDARAVIASIESEELFDGVGKERERIGTLQKVKLWDKGKALDLAARHLGMVRESPQLQVGALTLVIQD